jgi:sodium-dependent phosphate transporter
MAAFEEYLWITITGIIIGFLYSFGIGANDVANAFATSVASKSISLRQAVVIAAIFEFCGALFLGASVTSTVRGKIFDTSYYEDQPEVVMLGFMTSLVTASIMLLVATSFGMPVSTTHTVVGAIVGFSCAAEGFESINWPEFINIIISWFVSPLVTGVVGFIIFYIIKRTILLSSDPFTRGYYSFSIILFLTIGLNVFYVFAKGTKNFSNFQDEVYDIKWVIPTSWGVGLVCGLLWIYPFGPMAKKTLEQRKLAKEQEQTAVSSTGDAVEQENEVIDPDDEEERPEPSAKQVVVSFHDTVVTDPSEGNLQDSKRKSFASKLAAATFNQDLEKQSFHESKSAQECWSNMTHYDEGVEQLFTFVQVFTASMNSFAHGANDIANAIAPVAGILAIYQTGELNSKAPVPKWILAYGGVGLVLGLALYGYKVMKTIGYKLTALSPTRGASAELAASLTVVSASYVGLPVSTTQCIVGAVSGIGCVEGWRTVQWRSLAKVCVSWVLVFFTAAVLSAGMFSFCYFSPSAMDPVVANATVV